MQAVFDFGGQFDPDALAIKRAIFLEQFLQHLGETRAARGDHLDHQQAGQDAVLFGKMPFDRQPSALFAAEDDLVFVEQFANELEPDRRFKTAAPVPRGDLIEQVRRRYAACYTARPRGPRLAQVIEH